MKFKKIIEVLLLCVLASALLTGCGGTTDKSSPSSDNNQFKLGMIAHLNATEKSMQEVYDEAVKRAGMQMPVNSIKYYDNMNAMQLGLDANDVQEISTYKCVADYITAVGKQYEIVAGTALDRINDSFCFAVRKDEDTLRAELDKAIDEMKADGTLDKLINEYITDVKPDNIRAVDIPKIDGAQTLKVGVTGDLPPLDFVTADGKPAGFNTAMLAEIAKRINRNIEVVQVESAARAAALSSKQIDVVFWAVVPENESFPKDIDKPEGIELSKPYFKDHIAHIRLKKNE